jgi:3-dehydroquinate synthase
VSYRNLLNFGHTFGHAIEKSSELEGISHGMAVATGMLMALDASSLSGFKLAQAKKDIIEIYGYLNIPVTPSGIDPKKLMDALDFDKKFESGRTKFVLLSAINKPFFSYNPGRDIIEEAVRRNISV